MSYLLSVSEIDERVGINLREQVSNGPPGIEQTRILALLDRQEDVLLRTSRPGHLTGSALVVDPSDRRILLIFHTKLQRWLQPGGHADGDSFIARVALREAIEETGIEGLRVYESPLDFDIHTVHPPDEDVHEHYDMRYLVVAPPGAVPVGNHESEAACWVERRDLPGFGVDMGLLRLSKSALDCLTDLETRQEF